MSENHCFIHLSVFCFVLFQVEEINLVIVIPLWPETEKANQIFSVSLFIMNAQLGITKHFTKIFNMKGRDLNK